MSGCNPCSGPSSACQPQAAKSVQGEQQADQAMQQAIMVKMQRGEISPEEGQKLLQALTQHQADLQGTLAPGGAPDAGSSPPPPPARPLGFSMVDSFDSGFGAGSKPPVALSAPTAPAGYDAHLADLLENSGGIGSKPSVAGGEN